MRPHPPPGPQALRVPGQERPCIFVLCGSVEVTHSVSEGVSGSQVGMGTTASLAELPLFCLCKGLTHGLFTLKKLILKNRAQPKASGNGDGETWVLRKSLQ